MSQHDGGPAFPNIHQEVGGYTLIEASAGLSVRDYFAAAIMSGREAQENQRTYSSRAHFHTEWAALSIEEWQAAISMEDAKYCYAMADAMMKAREAKP